MVKVRWLKKKPNFMTLTQVADLEEGITAKEKLLYFILSRYADNDGCADMSIDTIARNMICSKASARRAIHGLIDPFEHLSSEHVNIQRRYAQ